MKTIKYLLLTVIFSTVLFVSCQSPADTDSPTISKRLYGIPLMASPSSSEIILIENGIEKLYQFDSDLKYQMIEIDTAVYPPTVTMHYIMNSQANSGEELSRIITNKIELRLDSIPADGKPYIFQQFSPIDYAKFQLKRGINLVADTLVRAGEKINYSEIKFTYSKDLKELRADLTTKLYDSRIWIVTKDTTYMMNVEHIRFDTTWANGVPVKVDTVKYTEQIQVTDKVGDQKRVKDSLQLTGRFKYQF
jgi:hypothetical protein